MKNFKLKPSICIASPEYCKNICPPDANCGMRRFLNKYGFNYLEKALPNYSRQINPIIPDGQHYKVERIDRLVSGQRSIKSKATSADTLRGLPNYLPQEKPNLSFFITKVHSQHCDDSSESSREKDNLEEILFIGSMI